MAGAISQRERAPNVCVQLTALALAIPALALIWAGFDDRLVSGEKAIVWLKPFKFAVSLSIHFATLAAIVRQTSPATAQGWLVRGAGVALVVAFLFEMSYVIVQSALAQEWYYNQSSAFYAGMYMLMGVRAVTLIAVPVAVGWAARKDLSIGASARVGILWGAAAAFILALLIGGTISSSFSHFVGTPQEGAPTFPLFGWSGSVGDLRAPHSFATHIFQVLVIVGLWADWAQRSPTVVRSSPEPGRS